MAYSVRVQATAEKQLSKPDRPTARRIITYLKEVAAADDPRSRGKALVGRRARVWRYRVGDYRVLCEINDGILLILVVEVGRRSGVYRN